MTHAIAVQSPESKAQLIDAMRNSLYIGASTQSIEMVLGYCQASGLDPMTKPVHIVPVWNKKANSMIDTIMPGIGLYRIIADRSGKYAGQDDAEFGPDMEGWGIRFPQWCKVTIYKITPAGRVPYIARVYWLESYATAGKDTDMPNAMWKKRPFGQLEKCAEAAALRKAFPEIGSQPTADEMDGRILDYQQDEVIELHVPATTTLSRTEQAKSKLLAQQHRKKVVESLEKSGAMPPLDVDRETGEAEADPIADLLLAIDACQSKEELEAHRDAVAGLKNGQKRRAVDAWKSVEARLQPSA